MHHKICVEQLKADIPNIHMGDTVELSGYIYTARDAAHKRMDEMLNSSRPLPFELDGAIIYYAGPTPGKGDMPVGSCGPTTSGRMDVYTPRLLDLGLTAMIGKGERSREVVDAIKRNGAIYFCAVGGAGALYAKCIKECTVIAFDELGCESIKKMKIVDFPIIAAIDYKGNNLFSK